MPRAILRLMYGHLPYFLPFLALPFVFPLVLLLITWTLIIKGYALWKAARNTQKGWYIAMLIVNSLGILEIIYLIWFQKDAGAPGAASSAPEQQ